MRINPYFELNGDTYEIKKTRYLIAEYDKISKENELSAEDKENAIKANNLVADVQKFAEKEKECWEKLCENPTAENRNVYLMFKEMSDNAIVEYNKFVSSTNSLEVAMNNRIIVLKKVAMKALAEQYFGFNEHLAKQTWEMFEDTMESQAKVNDWLVAMAECLFENDEEEENDSFLSKKRKLDMEKANNRKNGFRKKR